MRPFFHEIRPPAISRLANELAGTRPVIVGMATPPDPVGRIVLVKSAVDRHHPPIARRGTIIRREATPAGPRVVIELEFPQMFTRPVHRRTLVLEAPATARLLASENNGVYEITLAEDLDEPGAG